MSVLKKISNKFIYIYLFTGSTFLCAQKSTVSEYHVKAAFLFNFTHFVEWPASSFTSANSPMVIGVLEGNPFNSYLEMTIKGEIVNGHPLQIQYFKNIEDVKTCHILFINISETNKVQEILKEINNRNILTVSDSPDFLKQGGMIRFFIRNNKIQLQINPNAAAASNLIISSKLLRLAEIVDSNKK